PVIYEHENDSAEGPAGMKNVISLHKEEYGSTPQISVLAPGVAHILGEHTEFTGGFSLPFALNRSICLCISQRRDNSLRFYAADYNERKRTSIANIKYKREDRWANYLKGVINAFIEAGYSMKGFDITLQGNIPSAVGLGSSAALTVAAAFGIKTLLGISVSDRNLIGFARHAETKFMEMETGVIETFASFQCKKKHALFLDTKYLEFRHIPLELKGIRFLITDSQVPRLAGDDFSQQKKDYAKSIELLGQRRPGTTLRDYSPKDIRESIGILPEILRRRCLHVVEENVRVKEAEEILRAKGSLAALGKILYRSHDSLRDLLEVSCPEVDWLVKRSAETEGVYGSRLTGVGFGRCTITMIREDAVAEYEKRLEEYEKIFGFKAVVFVCEASEGVKLL
ncbi:MAG: galactokinase, partial [Spirochaetaceae bacterium]|nr:galactokinase [Spirochaetaceae bacterium]